MQRTIGLALLAGAPLAGLAAAACGSSSSSAAPSGADAATSLDGTMETANDAAADAALLDGSPEAAGDASSTCPNLPAATLVPPTSPLVVEGDPGSALGIYDPSLVYPTGAAGGLMSYSTVAPNSVHTRIAVSTDRGATFQYAADANDIVSPIAVTTTDPGFCEDGPCQVQGVLWHEVSSIVADPSDTAAPYKLFVHSYVSANGGATLRRDWGYIGMQSATSPTSWGTETKLLGWSSNATISTAGVTQVLSNIPELADCVAFTEPAALVGPLGIDLALSCAYSPSPGVVNIRVELLRSTDHAASFLYVSKLVAAEDFACIHGAAPQILGADLFTVGSSEYVIVSPTGPVSNTDAGGYRGCVTIPLADAGAGLIARASNGAPAVVSFVEAADGRFTGPCTYAEGATAIGQLVPMQFSPTDLPLFRIMRTTIPEP
jgi:hypothetical protein